MKKLVLLALFVQAVFHVYGQTIDTPEDMKRVQAICNQQRSAGGPTAVSDECRVYESFTFAGFTADNALLWLRAFHQDSTIVYKILDPETGIPTSLFPLIFENMGYIKDEEREAIDLTLFQVLVENLMTRSGHNARTLTVEDIAVAGTKVVYGIPNDQILLLSNTLLDYILELLYNNTKPYIDLANDMRSGSFSLAPLDIDQYALLQYIELKNVPKMKALCSATFNRYRNVSTEDVWKKTKFLIFCAPYEVCKTADSDLVRRDYLDLGLFGWDCKKVDGNPDHPDASMCGRILATKITDNSSVISLTSNSALNSIVNLRECIPRERLTAAGDSITCGTHVTALASVQLSSEAESAVLDRCLSVPDDASAVTCAQIQSDYGPFLRRLTNAFMNSLQQSVLCDTNCMHIFSNSPFASHRRMIMSRCYAASAPAISSAALISLGGMVADLPMSRLRSVAPEDLAATIDGVKERVQGSAPRTSALKTIAVKMATSGNLKKVADSEQIMTQMSLARLKSTVNDVQTDLGLDDDQQQFAFTAAQKSWVMQKVVENKSVETFTPTDIRGLRQLATGLTSAKILKMKKSSNPFGLAMALCEQSNWPLKTLKAINQELIQKGLELRDANDPMSTFKDLDVDVLGCECMLHFKKTQIQAMSQGTCSATCRKIGICDRFRCINPTSRRKIFDACMQCLDVSASTLTSVQWELLGLNLLSQMTAAELATIPAFVVELNFFKVKEMCLSPTQKTGLIQQLTVAIGSDTSSYSENTIKRLGSAIQYFTQEQQRAMDKNAIANMAEQIADELGDRNERRVRLRQCCERWFTGIDGEIATEQKRIVMLTLKEAIIHQMTQRRRKRQTVQWTCTHIEILQEAFTTASVEELNAMENAEFLMCLANLGQLTTWSEEQKAALFSKAITVLSASNACNLTAADIVNLGVILHAASETELRCMPLNDDDVLSAVGALPDWTEEQRGFLAEAYENKVASDLSASTAADIATAGYIVCGLRQEVLNTLTAETFVESGTVIGQLKGCTANEMSKFVSLATNAQAYGNISSWTTAEILELGYIITGLNGKQIQQISLDSVEGLTVDVIPQIPEYVFAEMTEEQFKSFTDAQAGSVTISQKAVMGIFKRSILRTVILGGDAGALHDIDLSAGPGGVIPGQTGVSHVVNSLLLFLSLVIPLINLLE